MVRRLFTATELRKSIESLDECYYIFMKNYVKDRAGGNSGTLIDVRLHRKVASECARRSN
jgi:hypothetical protein